MKESDELMHEIARILASRCFCHVGIVGDQIEGIPNWHIVCTPQIVRKNVLPERWNAVIKQAETKQQMPMLIHPVRGDWAGTFLSPYAEIWNWEPDINATWTAPLSDWWWFAGEELAFPGRRLEDASRQLGFRLKH